MNLKRTAGRLSDAGRLAAAKLVKGATVIGVLATLAAFFLLPAVNSEAGSPRVMGLTLIVVVLVCYVIGTILAVPSTGLSIAATLALGLEVAIPVSILGATLGGFGASLLGRRLGSNSLDAILSDLNLPTDWPSVQRSIVLVAAIRFSPLVPINLSNYALGVSRVPAPAMIVGTIVGIAPHTVLTCLATSGIAVGSPQRFSFAAVGILVTAYFSVALARRLRSKATQGSEETS